ncbi:MAG: transposase, partial [Lachnospiraceae bacterium]|nr:transposase [Lachnospiraceae bacterium]
MTPKRKISPTGIYHITVRGINKQNIFETKEDYEKYLEILRKYESICDFQLLGYCLMSNHVHLIIKVGEMPLGRIFQHISPS